MNGSCSARACSLPCARQAEFPSTSCWQDLNGERSVPELGALHDALAHAGGRVDRGDSSCPASAGPLVDPRQIRPAREGHDALRL
jgi:hypothetical protein